MSQHVRVRFAPSPTGDPHVGNIRTALFAWLFARHNQGDFLVRIEDTDQTREKEGSVKVILESLHWLGMDIDEGVIAEDAEQGDCGPYYQSKRLDIYEKYIQELVEKDHAYHCFCSAERLDALRAKQQEEKQPPRYDGHCLSLSKEEVTQKLEAGESYVIRMKVPEDRDITFDDVIKGPITINTNTVDHQVLIKSDGFPTYHFASVVDDHLMKISHVIRSDEWIASTPKHILLYEYFSWDAPAWVHVPIVLGPDKAKLSKRHAAVSVLEYKKQGYLPHALMNYLALLGWNPKTNQEIFEKDALIQAFELSKVNKNNPIFDLNKLNWMNGEYIKKMDVEALAELILRGSVLADEANPSSSESSTGLPQSLTLLRKNDVVKAIKLVQDRLETLNQFEELTAYLWADDLDYDASILIPKKGDAHQTQNMLHTSLELLEKQETWNEESLRTTFMDYTEKHDIKRGDMLWPLRVAITGLERSPDVFGSMDVLGKEQSIDRLKKAIQKSQ